MSQFTKMGSMLAVAAAAVAARGADAQDDLKSAIQKLADQASYSWTSKKTGESPGKDPQAKGDAKGKTEKGGITLLTFIKGTKQTEAALRADKIAVKTAEGWKIEADFQPKEDPKAKPDKSLLLAQTLKKYLTPAAEATALLEQVKELKNQGEGVFSGELKDESVKDYIERNTKAGKKPAKLSEPKVTARFWVRDGVLVRYEIALEGKKTKSKSKTEVTTKTTTVVEIKDIGTTKLEVADDARKKLE